MCHYRGNADLSNIGIRGGVEKGGAERLCSSNSALPVQSTCACCCGLWPRSHGFAVLNECTRAHMTHLHQKCEHACCDKNAVISGLGDRGGAQNVLSARLTLLAIHSFHSIINWHGPELKLSAYGTRQDYYIPYSSTNRQLLRGWDHHAFDAILPMAAPGLHALVQC